VSLIPQFLALLSVRGSAAIFHRDDSTVTCPCLTPEGFRDPIWHALHPEEPVCNEAGMLPNEPVHVSVRAFVQPIQSTRATRLQTELLVEMFGEIQADDHLGIFPVNWNGVELDFRDWGRAGEDYIGYDGRFFTVVNVNAIPDPSDGNPRHHYEVGLRLVRQP
jgi:hypothetical protein